MLCDTCKRQIADDAVFCPHCNTPVPGAQECTDYTYEAFISYRHHKHDRAAATWLQRFLEGFRIPKNLSQDRASNKLGKLFRDEDELSTADSLPKLIQDALIHSRYLIVVCSPHSVESQWVQREVEMFASLHGRHRILLLLVEGEPDESFPPLLRNHVEVDPDGSERLVEEEPLAADFRDAPRKKRRTEALRIAATLIGCNFDDLRQRMRLRRTRTIALAASVISAISISFGAFSLYQQEQIKVNHRASQFHESELLASEAEELLSQGDRYQAIQVALRALPTSSTDNSRPFVPAASLVLQRAMGLYPSSGMVSRDYSLPLSNDSSFFAFDDGYLVTMTNTDDIEVRSIPFGEELYTLKKDELFPDTATSERRPTCINEGGDRLVICYDNETLCFDAENGEELWRNTVSGDVRQLRVGEDVVAILSATGSAKKTDAQKDVSVVMYRTSDGKTLQTLVLDDLDSGQWNIAGSSDSGDIVVCGSSDGRLVTLDSAGASQTARTWAPSVVDAYCLDGRLFVMSGDEDYNVNGGTVFIESFDANLQQLWVHESTIPTWWDTEGHQQYWNVGICGSRLNGGERDGIVASLGPTLITLGVDTGGVLSSDTFEASVLDCCPDPGGFIIAALANGKVAIISGTGDSRVTMVEEITTCDLTTASIVKVSGIGIHIIGKSLAPTKLAVFHFGDSYISEAIAEPVEWLPETAKVIADNNQIAMVDGGNVSFLDPETLEAVFTLPCDRFPGLTTNANLRVLFANADVAYVWSEAEGHEEDALLYRISRSDDGGAVDASVTLEDAFGHAVMSEENEDRLHIDVNGNIAWVADNRVVLLDGKSLSITREIPATEGRFITNLCNGVDNVLVCEQPSYGEGQLGWFRLVDKTTGQDVASDLDAYNFAVPFSSISDYATLVYRRGTSTGFPLAMDASSNRAALPCSDGFVRVVNLADGSQVWETAETAPHLAFMMFVASGDLLVQGENGRCLLLSGSDGTVVGSTRISLPTLTKPIRDEGSHVYVGYTDTSMMNNNGMAMIMVDRDSFGPLADMPLGVAVDAHETRYLAADDGYETYALFHNDFDTLISGAQYLCEGHELTEAESALYQVEER